MGASDNNEYFDRSLKDQVIMGDCMDVIDSMPDNSVDMVLTDPPYHVPVAHFVSTYSALNTRHIEDTSILSTYFKMLFKKLKRVTSPNGVWYVFCDGQSYPIFYNLLLPLCYNVRPLIWDKIYPTLGSVWRHQHEIIAYAVPDGGVNFGTGDGDVLRYKSVPSNKRQHPVQKPLDLLQSIVRKHQNVKTVLDPFAGSGSSLVAALTSGRNYTGIELNEKYVSVCKERLANSKSGMDGFAPDKQEKGLRY